MPVAITLSRVLQFHLNRGIRTKKARNPYGWMFLCGPALPVMFIIAVAGIETMRSAVRCSGSNIFMKSLG